MSYSGIFLLLAFLMSIAVIILWPLIAHPAKLSQTTNSSVISVLQVQFRTIVAAIHELDADHETGKVTDGDYQVQREALLQRGIATLTQIDERMSDAIEAAVRTRRKMS